MNGENKKTILLVEDEVLIAMTQKMSLERHGYTVITVNTGEKAVETVRKTPEIDLILMDINLGKGIDGTEAAAIILKERNLPVVFLSSHTDPAMVEKTEKITSYGYVVKNSNITVLDASIKMAFKLFDAKMQERQHETELLHTTYYLHSIIRTTRDGFCVVDMNGRFSDVNDAYAEMCGYSREEMLKLSIQDIAVDEHPELTTERLQQIKSTGHAFFEARNRRKDGTVFDIEVSTSFLGGEEDKIVAFYRDITERKKAEEKLRESENRYRLLFQNLNFANSVYEVLLDKNGKSCDYKFLEVNSVFEENTGKKASELIGKTLLELFPQTENYWLEKFEQVFLTGIPIRFEEYSKELDTHLELNIYSPEKGQIAWASIDITERKRAEEALRESEKRYRLIADNTSDSIWIMDPALQFIYLSPSTNKLFGYTLQEWQSLDWDTFVHRDDIGRVRRVFNNLIERKTTTAREIIRVRRKDGCELWVDFSANAILDQDGKISNIVGVTRDITELKRSESELLKAQLITENMPVGLHLYHLEDLRDDRTLRMVYANPAVKILTGIGPENMVGKTLDENFPNLRAQGLPQSYAEVVRTQIPISFEDIIYGDDRVIQASFSVKAFPLPGNHVGVAFDNITERKKAEEALKKSENRFRNIFEHSPIAIWEEDITEVRALIDDLRSQGVTNFDSYIDEHPDFIKKVIPLTKVVNVNKQALTLFEAQSKDELLGPLSVKYVKEDSDMKMGFKETILSIAEGKHYIEREGKVTTLNGKRPDVILSHYIPSESELLSSMIVQALDITERKTAEEKLRESEKRFRRLTENARDMIYRMSLLDGKYEYVSPACLELMGYTQEEFYNGIAHISRFIHPAFADFFRMEWENLLKGNVPKVYEYKIFHKDGTERWFHQRNVLVRNDNGLPIALEGIVTDITDRKKNELELSSLLKQKEVLMKELQHRVKNTLSLVGSVISWESERLTDEQSKNIFQEVQNRIIALASIYENLYKSDDINSVNLHQYIEELAHSLCDAYVSDSSKISLSFKMGKVVLDLKRSISIGLVVNELMTNTLKYAYPSDKKGTIDIYLKEFEGKIELGISDNGVGLPDGFDIEKSASFGMMLVKLLTEELGGNLSITSKEGTSIVLDFRV